MAIQYLVPGKGYYNAKTDLDFVIPYYGYMNDTNGALLNGLASLVSFSSTICTVKVTNAIGGTAPYAYQWYRSTTPGFTPGGGNIVGGATNQTLNDTGLTDGTTYYYKNVVTDNIAATSISNQISVTPVAPQAGAIVINWSF